MSEKEEGMAATIFGKRCKVVIKDHDDPFNSIVVCPHCGNHVKFNDIITIHGKAGCLRCALEFSRSIEQARSEDPLGWHKRDWEPHGL